MAHYSTNTLNTQGVALGYVVVGLSARIVNRQVPLVNIEIKH